MFAGVLVTHLEVPAVQTLENFVNKVKTNYKKIPSLSTYIKKLHSEDEDVYHRSFLMIWSHSLKKSLMENFIFFAVRPSPFFTDGRSISCKETAKALAQQRRIYNPVEHL